MSLHNKIASAALLVIAFVVGLLIGRFWKDIPFLTLDGEVQILDIFNFLLAVAVAFWVPIVLKKAVEDTRDVKSFLVEEIKDLLEIYYGIRKIISDSYSGGSIAPADKDKINLAFHEAEMKVGSIVSQVEISFKKRVADINPTLKDLQFNYKDYLTGGALMMSSFIAIDDQFYREHGTKFSILETGLKTLIHKIYKL